MTGWECPRCGRVWAPYVQECLGPHNTQSATSTQVMPQICCTACGGTHFGAHTCPAAASTASLSPGGQRVEPSR